MVCYRLRSPEDCGGFSNWQHDALVVASCDVGLRITGRTGTFVHLWFVRPRDGNPKRQRGQIASQPLLTRRVTERLSGKP